MIQTQAGTSSKQPPHAEINYGYVAHIGLDEDGFIHHQIVTAGELLKHPNGLRSRRGYGSAAIGSNSLSLTKPTRDSAAEYS